MGAAVRHATTSILTDPFHVRTACGLVLHVRQLELTLDDAVDCRRCQRTHVMRRPLEMHA